MEQGMQSAYRKGARKPVKPRTQSHRVRSHTARGSGWENYYPRVHQRGYGWVKHVAGSAALAINEINDRSQLLSSRLQTHKQLTPPSPSAYFNRSVLFSLDDLLANILYKLC